MQFQSRQPAAFPRVTGSPKTVIHLITCKTTISVYTRGGGGTDIYGLYRYVPLCRVWFSSSLLSDRVYKSERLSLEQGIIYQETDQLVEDFI